MCNYHGCTIEGSKKFLSKKTGKLFSLFKVFYTESKLYALTPSRNHYQIKPNAALKRFVML